MVLELVTLCALQGFGVVQELFKSWNLKTGSCTAVKYNQDFMMLFLGRDLLSTWNFRIYLFVHLFHCLNEETLGCSQFGSFPNYSLFRR